MKAWYKCYRLSTRTLATQIETKHAKELHPCSSSSPSSRFLSTSIYPTPRDSYTPGNRWIPKSSWADRGDAWWLPKRFMDTIHGWRTWSTLSIHVVNPRAKLKNPETKLNYSSKGKETKVNSTKWFLMIFYHIYTSWWWKTCSYPPG